MPYNAMDVANYIIKRAIDRKKSVSNVRVQKLLYYLQARFLVDRCKPLFTDEIGKWKYGPVVSDVYHEYKSYGSSNIEKVSQIFKVLKDENGVIKDIIIESFDEDHIKECDKRLIDETIDALDGYGSFQLVDITHEQPLWKEFEEEIIDREPVDPYNTLEIQKYFSLNESEQLWKNQ